jgi:hypothetical protein
MAQALPAAGQPAMMVMAVPRAVAAIITEPFVSDSRTAAPGLAPPPRCDGCALPVLDPRRQSDRGGIMTTTTSQRQPDLTGQTVIVTGGGIGLRAARRARAEGAGPILTGRNPGRLEQAAAGFGAVSRAALNAASPAAPGRFPGGLPKQAGCVMVAAAGPAVR